MGRAITIHPIITGDPCTPIRSTGPGPLPTGSVPFGTLTWAGITSAALPMALMEQWAARPGITPPPEDTGDLRACEVGMAGRGRARPVNPVRAGLAPR